MKRRDFMRNTGVAVSAPLILNGLPVQAVNNVGLLHAIYSLPTNRVLVVVQMAGGNDGLNMILPIDKYNELSQTGSNGGRQEILIPSNLGKKFEIGGVDQYVNTKFHPAMSSLATQFSDQKLCVVQGAGYQNQSFSHFRSTDIWMSGSDPAVIEETGWVGRKLDKEHPNYLTSIPSDPLALTIGSVSPNLFMGSKANMGVAIANPTANGGISSQNIDTLPNTVYGYELDYIRNVAQQTNNFYTSVQAAYSAGQNLATYPNNYFANQLKTVARLLNGGIDTRFFMVSIGGFDTHDGQVDVNDHSFGNHANILKMLSDGVLAFQNDLAQLPDNQFGGFLEDRVLGMTFSEFGRTIKANTTRGTDHGTSAPLMLFGQDVNPVILGKNPDILDATNNMKSDLDVQFNFRSVYASILHQWFDLPKTDVDFYLGQSFNDGTTLPQNILDGGFHCNLPILKPGTSYTNPNAIAAVVGSETVMTAYPNPVHTANMNVVFESQGEEMEFDLYNALGQQVRHRDKQYFAAGKQELTVPVSDLPKGNYSYTLTGKRKLIGRVIVD